MITVELKPEKPETLRMYNDGTTLYAVIYKQNGYIYALFSCKSDAETWVNTCSGGNCLNWMIRSVNKLIADPTIIASGGGS